MSSPNNAAVTDGGGSDGIDGKQSLSGSVPSVKKSKPDARQCLLLYEAMVRRQDLELDATRDHVAATVERIKHLGRTSCAGSASYDEGQETPPPDGMLTYRQMRRCLLRLGRTWERSLPPSSSGFLSYSEFSGSFYDDDASDSAPDAVASERGRPSSVLEADADAVAADAQLVMLLTMLVETEERHRAEMLDRGDDTDEEYEDEHEALFSRGLFLPEFVQAYRLVIGGMQALQAFSGSGKSDGAMQEACTSLGMPVNVDALQNLRSRSRKRTMALLRLFGPDASLFRDEMLVDQGAREDDSSQDAREKGLAKRPGPSGDTDEGRCENEIQKLMRSKDATLVRVVDDHQAEMDAVATGMGELQLHVQKIHSVKTRRTSAMVILTVALLAGWGGLYKGHGWEQTQLEIVGGRVAGRQAGAETIFDWQSTVFDWHNFTKTWIGTISPRRVLTGRVMGRQAGAVTTLDWRKTILDWHNFTQTWIGTFSPRRVLSGRVAGRQPGSETFLDWHKTVLDWHNLTQIWIGTISFRGVMSGRALGRRSDAGAIPDWQNSTQKGVAPKGIFERLEEDIFKWLLDLHDLENCRLTRREIDDELSAIRLRNEDLEREAGWYRDRLASAGLATERMKEASRKGPALESRAVNTYLLVEAAKGVASSNSSALGNNSGTDEGGAGRSGDTVRFDGEMIPKLAKMETRHNKPARKKIRRRIFAVLGGMGVRAVANTIAKVFRLLFSRRHEAHRTVENLL